MLVAIALLACSCVKTVETINGCKIERCYKRQLHNFAEWMADSRDVRDMEAVSTADLLAYRQSIQHLATSS